MPTTWPDCKAEIARLAVLLNRSLSADRYEEAREYAERCVRLRTPETHASVIAVLECARQIALVRRSLSAARLESLRRTSEYLRNRLCGAAPR